MNEVNAIQLFCLFWSHLSFGIGTFSIFANFDLNVCVNFALMCLFVWFESLRPSLLSIKQWTKSLAQRNNTVTVTSQAMSLLQAKL